MRRRPQPPPPSSQKKAQKSSYDTSIVVSYNANIKKRALLCLVSDKMHCFNNFHTTVLHS